MQIPIECPFCFENFEVETFPEDGEVQNFTYDCEVCCHPIEIHVEFKDEGDEYDVRIEKSDGF